MTLSDFNEILAATKLKKFLDVSYMSNVIKCLPNVKKCDSGALTVVEGLSDFIDNDWFANEETLSKSELGRENEKIFEEKVMETFFKKFLKNFIKNIKEGSGMVIAQGLGWTTIVLCFHLFKK